MRNRDEMNGAETEGTEPEQEVSKSELKREMLALQKLGERLLQLAPERWREFAFGPAMLAALEESRRIRSHIALRRHTRRLAKLLQNEDTALVEALFRRMDNAQMQDTLRLHRLEQWRDRLLAEGDDALQALLQQCPDADRQHLRQLLRTARREAQQGRPPAARRKLFKYLKTLALD